MESLSGWISVEVLLPEPGKDVMVFCSTLYKGSKVITAGLFEGFGNLTINGKSDYGWASWETEDAVKGKVTHWMPIPEKHE